MKLEMFFKKCSGFLDSRISGQNAFGGSCCPNSPPPPVYVPKQKGTPRVAYNTMLCNLSIPMLFLSHSISLSLCLVCVSLTLFLESAIPSHQLLPSIPSSPADYSVYSSHLTQPHCFPLSFQRHPPSSLRSQSTLQTQSRPKNDTDLPTQVNKSVEMWFLSKADCNVNAIQSGDVCAVKCNEPCTASCKCTFPRAMHHVQRRRKPCILRLCPEVDQEEMT